eukprot:CAMPEP_0198250860 /NCGR_PEP_ID=MMETSP1447-20131203/1884_1 /TAXON_ID=420782 /ORGANISM="Chaetoceros dichaeta, Strain CCMP1751" /LENGTH=503 /DNA_ID=CAMNT_0043935757 /DNA_START=196 /DNA_END=1707 /DNA_ORIENTATION=+
MYRIKKKVSLFQTKTPSFISTVINTATTTTTTHTKDNRAQQHQHQHEHGSDESESETETEPNDTQSSTTCLVQLALDDNDTNHNNNHNNNNKLGRGRRSPKLFDHNKQKPHRRQEYFTIDDGDDDEDSCEQERSRRVSFDDEDGDEWGLARESGHGEELLAAGSADNGGGAEEDRPRSTYFFLCAKCFNCICPEFAILRLLLQCDLQTFWKLVPPILVTKAFYSSVIALGLCTLFKVQRHPPLIDNGGMIKADNPLTAITETYFFGLYTYTGNVEIGQSLHDQVTLEMQRVETCRFDMRQVDAEAPDRLFVNDRVFNVARGFAITAVVLGAASTVGLLLLTASSCSSRTGFPPPRPGGGGKLWWSLRWFNRERIRWILFLSLCLCGVFQSMAFLVFASSVCRDIEERGASFEYEDRQCLLGEGVGIIFSSCFCWWFTAIALVKMPIGDDGGVGVGGGVGGSTTIGSGESEDFSIEISGGGVSGRLTDGFVVPRDENGDSITIT